VYWIAVYDALEAAGLEVYLVNARETKNLPGRKTDVQESQWLMKLHTYGLLRNSFRPCQEPRPPFGWLREPESPVPELGGLGAWQQLRIPLQPDSTVKAAFSLERSCPKWSLAPVLAIAWMVAGIVLAKGNGPTPMERLCKFRYPGRARLNSSARTRIA
jgi:hypothetical protein